MRTSLVVQWLRIHLPMQGPQVRSWFREISGQLSLYATTTEPVQLQPMVHKRSHCSEKPTHRNKEEPLLAATTENPLAAAKAQCSRR